MRRLREQNAVIIRFWHSAATGGTDVGHVSIEIPAKNIYASLWPIREIGLSELTAHVTHCPFPQASYDNDRWLEKRPADTEVILYSLDIEGIYAEYKRKERSVTGWTAIAGMAFSLHDNTESCASLAFKLLKAGNIARLTDSGRSSIISSVVTPDGLRIYVNNAKKNETTRHPETQRFSVETLQRRPATLTTASARTAGSRLNRRRLDTGARAEPEEEKQDEEEHEEKATAKAITSQQKLFDPFHGLSPALFKLPTINDENPLLKPAIAFLAAYVAAQLPMNVLCFLGLAACTLTLLFKCQNKNNSGHLPT